MDANADNLYFSFMATSASRSVRQRQAVDGGDIPAFFLYGEPLQPPDERLIHVETIAARSRLHDWKIRPHRHRDLHQLLLIHRGDVAATLDDETFSLPAPALVAVPPGCVHSFTFQPGTLGVVISCAAGLVAELATASGGLGELLERPTARTLARAAVRETDLRSLADMLLREFARSAPGRHAALRGLLGAVLGNVLRLARQSDGHAPAAAPARELVARFRRLIEARYRTHAGINAYATALGVSESRLRRACAQATGQAPVELLHARVVVEAERQLRYSTMSIAQIAYYLGFDDPAYFSRFFALRTRVSPRAFRERDRAAAQPARAGAGARAV